MPTAILTVTSIRVRGGAESGAVVDQLIGLARSEGVRFREAGMAALLSDESRVSGGTHHCRRTGLFRSCCRGCGSMVTVIVAVALGRNLGDRTAGTSFSSRRRRCVQSSEFLPVVCGQISLSGWYGFPALEDGRVKVANHGVGTRLHPDQARNRQRRSCRPDSRLPTWCNPTAGRPTRGIIDGCVCTATPSTATF